MNINKKGSKYKEIYKLKKLSEYKKFKNLDFTFKCLISLIIIIISLSSSYIVCDKRSLDEINPDKNKISLIIKGSGTKQVFNCDIMPDIVIINDELQTEINSINSFTFDKEENTIILKWKTLFTSCRDMFRNINDIISIDLSNFNTSQVTDMTSMFDNCHVNSINLKNFNTSIVFNMGCMFCNNEINYLDLSSFKTSKVKNMKFMFSYCTKLKELNLANFDTSSVDNMDYMFWNAKSLKILNLYNFDISSVTSMSNIFEGCNSLLYLNIISFEEKNGVILDNIFSDNLDLLVYCIDKQKAPNIFEKLGTNWISDCENKCFSKSKINIVQKECNDKCIPYECENEDNYDSSYSSVLEEFINSHSINNDISGGSENNEV